MIPRVVVSWSTGKDAAWCLDILRRSGEVEVIGLVTTVAPTFSRVSIHGTRLEVLHSQAAGLRLPVWQVNLPFPCSNREYETAMADAMEGMMESWAPTHIAFGDLFLEDVRAYREESLAHTPLDPLFPIWGEDTGVLAEKMWDQSLEAVIVSAPSNSRASPFVGERWAAETIAKFPRGIDPCGEHGEFHTCFVGGLGLDALPVETGEVVQRDGALYCDLILQKD